MCYIENRFMLLTEQNVNGEKLRTKWKSDKELYTGMTAVTVFDFQHYSLHDKSHSVRVLQNIELLLGRPQVDRLGLGDLWLLLQSAYFHDIGMSLCSEDIDKLWGEDSSFHSFLNDRLREGPYRDNVELYDAIEYHQKVDSMLNNKSKFNAVLQSDTEEPGPDWPIRLVQNTQYIVAEYVRQKHGTRSKNFFHRIFYENKAFAEGIIERRLYELIGTISFLHAESDFDKLLELPKEEIAFGDEHIHPRFAAAILRMGDLLDMDNNRFNLRVLEHRGALPPKSMAHLHKHKALRHLNITEKGIFAEARSDDFDACLETRNWYNWIDDEFASLVKNWNQIAPETLGGCQLETCTLRVYLNGALFTARNLNHFNFDSRKMQKLLIGDNIYDCRLDCLREYVQNAIDATKVYLWNKLKQRDIDGPIKKPDISLENLLPCDLKEEAFTNTPIEILFSYDESGKGLANDKICIEIKDRGIGMDRECVDGITTIGKGWRAREEYRDVFTSAPKWLQPTGGFGIGIQSAFMITDEVDYKTRSEKEGMGHHIRLISPERNGNVTREDYHYDRSHGTTVTFRVAAMKFMNCAELGICEDSIKRIQQEPRTMFNKKAILEKAIQICEDYLREQMPNSIFPIYIGEKDMKPKCVASPYLYQSVSPLKMLNFKEELLQAAERGQQYRYVYYISIDESVSISEKVSKIILWNTQYMDCVCLAFSDDPPEDKNLDLKERIKIAFKNISVLKEKRSLNGCSAFLDIMGERAEECLQVSRSKLNSDFEDQLNARLHNYLEFCLERMIAKYVQERKEKRNQSKNLQYENLKEVISDDDIVTNWSFVRMIFCMLTYLRPESNASWLTDLQSIRHFGQEILDSPAINVREKGSKKAVSMFNQCLNRLLHKEPNYLPIFFCTGLPDNQIALPSPDGSSASIKFNALLKSLTYIEANPQKEASAKQQEQVVHYLLQHRERLFSSEWGMAVFGSGEGFWQSYHKASFDWPVQGRPDNDAYGAFTLLTVYFPLAPSFTTNNEDASNLPQKIFYNDEKLYEKYPLAISKLPFHTTLAKSQWAIVSPMYPSFRSALEELRNSRPKNAEAAVKRVAEENANFRALVDWVYAFQVQPYHEQPHTKSEIEKIYLNWIWDYYQDPRLFDQF